MCSGIGKDTFQCVHVNDKIWEFSRVAMAKEVEEEGNSSKWVESEE